MLPAVLAAARAGVESVVVPAANEVEASVVPGVEVRAVPLLMTDVAATAEMARRALELAGA